MARSGMMNRYPEFECQRNDLFAERSQVVLVAVTRFLDEAVSAKPAENSGHLAAAVLREPSAQRLVPHAADGELPAGERRKERFIIRVEEIEPAIRARVLVNGS